MEQCNRYYKTMHHKVEKRVSSGVRAVKGEYDNIRDRLVNEDQRAGNAIASVRSKIPDLGL